MYSSSETRKKWIAQQKKRCWFSQMYEFRDGGHLPLDKIMEDYESEKENLRFQVEKRDVRALINDVFGEAKIVQPRGRDGKRSTVFINIAKRTQENNSPSWTDLIVSTTYKGWILRSKVLDPPELHFSRLTGEIIDGNEVVVQLKIDPLSLDFTLQSFLGHEINGSDMGLNGSQNISLFFLLGYLSCFTVCSGVAVDNRNEAVVRRENDNICSKVRLGNSQEVFVSKKCQQMVSSPGVTCTECLYLKKLLAKRKETYTNIMKTKNCLLGDEDKIAKINLVLKEKRNAIQRERYWKQKFAEECFSVTDEDHKDFETLLGAVDSTEIKGEMALLLDQQVMALKSKSGKGHRWHPKIIRLCLDLYSTSPKAFDTMKQHLILPSKRLISYYKNSISSSSGWNAEVVAWCHREASKLKLKDQDLWGGLIFDEMTIQEDLEFVRVGGHKKLTGAVALGQSYEDGRCLVQGNNEPELASKVMQFAIVTDSGFRFALAHFPVKSMPAVTLLEKFWEGVELCERAGFRIYWVLCDGGEPNRSFLKLLFPADVHPADHQFVAENLHTGGRIVAMADSKHNFKKIRNHLEKSTLSEKSPRKLTVNNSVIIFKFWKDAYEWDQANHSLPLHERLTDAHFDLTPRSRMRNSLAEEVLDDRMLYLMEKYKEHLASMGKTAEADALKEPIRFLSYTSKLIDLFSRKEMISTVHDTRLIKAREFLDYLQSWKDNASSPKEFLSDQLWFDLRSMIIGLQKVVEIKMTHFKEADIKPVIINQDILENIFCQERGSNGQNNHPKYYMYSSTLTAVNIGQSVVSKKGNAFKKGNTAALPFAGLPLEHPFSRKRRLSLI